ncbi:MAG: T9SS type A sorting domain-containing protein, partial [Bacteroidota bacterium]
TFNTAGTYYIELRYETDCCGLSDPDTVTLLVDPRPSLTLAGPASFCAGDGGVNLMASGGNIYTWAPSTSLNASTGNSVIANPSSTSKYYVTAFNASQTCSVRDSITVQVNDLLLAESSTDEGCLPDGTASVIVNGGSGNYVYNWNTTPIQNTPTATGLASGSYEVLVTDMTTGCQDSVDVFVDRSPGNISAFANVINPVSCNGLSDGTASVSPSGGSGNYSYTWSPMGGAAATSAPLPAGNYTVDILDLDNGCQTSVSLTVPEAPPIAISTLASSDNDCQTIGAIQVNAGGGNGPFTYTWNTIPVQTGPVLDSVHAGPYTVTVEDQDGCLNDLTVNMQGPQPTILSLLSSQNASNCNTNDGVINVQASGDASISYNWLISPPQTGPTASNLFPGSYEVEAISAGGCRDTLGITIGPTCPLNNDLISFEARANGEVSDISWQISQEHSDFEIKLQRSANGLLFEPLWASRAKEDHGLIDYALRDEEVQAGNTYYYRLLLEDFAGNQTYSEIEEVYFPHKEEIELIGLFPNPVTDELGLKFLLSRNSRLHIKLYDTRGRLVLTESFEVNFGESKISLSLKDEAKGVYFVQIDSDLNYSKRIKIIKQ